MSTYNAYVWGALAERWFLVCRGSSETAVTDQAVYLSKEWESDWTIREETATGERHVRGNYIPHNHTLISHSLAGVI